MQLQCWLPRLSLLVWTWLYLALVYHTSLSNDVRCMPFITVWTRPDNEDSHPDQALQDPWEGALVLGPGSNRYRVWLHGTRRTHVCRYRPGKISLASDRKQRTSSDLQPTVAREDKDHSVIQMYNTMSIGSRNHKTIRDISYGYINMDKTNVPLITMDVHVSKTSWVSVTSRVMQTGVSGYIADTTIVPSTVM